MTDPTLLRMARAMCPMDWEKASGDIRAFWLERARLGHEALAASDSGPYRHVEVGWKNGEWYKKEDDGTGNAGALE